MCHPGPAAAAKHTQAPRQTKATSSCRPVLSLVLKVTVTAIRYKPHHPGTCNMMLRALLTRPLVPVTASCPHWPSHCSRWMSSASKPYLPLCLLAVSPWLAPMASSSLLHLSGPTVHTKQTLLAPQPLPRVLLLLPSLPQILPGGYSPELSTRDPSAQKRLRPHRARVAGEVCTRMPPDPASRTFQFSYNK